MLNWLEQNPSKATRLALAIAALTVAIYYAVGSAHGPHGHPTPIIRDAYIFHQYARQLAEGHPYQFNTGDAATTACTSHLWPTILAGAYLIGARGWAILTAAFAINAMLLLTSVVLFSQVMRRLNEKAAGLAVLIYVLCGQIYITELDQMDSALFVCVSLAMFAALLHDRRGWLIGLTFLAPWCRPEGVILSFFIFAGACVRLWGNRRTRDSMLIAGACGLAAHGLVMGLNYALTGTTTFHSVIGKSPFGMATPDHVIGETVRTAAEMAREIGLGLSGSQRQFMIPPVIGAALIWLGLMSRDWRQAATARAEACWIASALSALGLVAFSGWQGIQYDRYVTWMMPLAFAYIAMGIIHLARAGTRRSWGTFLAAGIMVWQVAGLTFLTTKYWGDCARSGANASFFEMLGKRFPDGTRIGMINGAGIKYIFPQFHVLNLNGIETPEFAHRDSPITNLEILKHTPSLRFNYWILGAANSPQEWFGAGMGEQVLAEVPALGAVNTHAVYRADWTKFDDALEIRSAAAKTAVEGMKLVDSLDVGWMEDERRHEYEGFTRVPGAKIQPHTESASCGEKMITEVGRVVIGSESFRITAAKGKALRIIMRTRLAGTPVIRKAGSDSATQEFKFSSPITLLLIVDDGEPQSISLQISGNDGAFAEAVLEIPAEAIRTENPVITIGGDHISFAYWFFQQG